jgi:RNA polymerase sigma-70 factor (ECF subfamily)
MDALFAGSLAARGTSAEKALEEAQAMQAVLREIDRLPAKERQVLLLAALEELDTAQVAEVMGRSEAAIRALLFRARARLRERLETKGGSS